MTISETVHGWSSSPNAQKQQAEIKTVAELQSQLSEINQQISQIKETTEQQTADSLGAMSEMSQRRLLEALDEMTKQAETAYDKPIQELAGQIKTVTESTATISDQAKTELPKLIGAMIRERKRLEGQVNKANSQAEQAEGASQQAEKQARNAAIHAHNTGKLMLVGMVLSALVASLVTCGIWLTVM